MRVLVAAAQRAGVRRVIAESVIFAYGYAPTGAALMDETDPWPRGGRIYNIVDDRPQSFGATAFGTAWLPLSNARANAELGWTPIPR